MKNTFEAIYQQIEDLEARYQIAKAAKDDGTMVQIRIEHMALDESIEAKGATFVRMYTLYEDAQRRGNEYIDISDCRDHREEAALIACFRECGIDTFTFSSCWSGAVESAWKFVQNGCSLMGMIEINDKITKWGSDEYEKWHAYLFKVN